MVGIKIIKNFVFYMSFLKAQIDPNIYKLILPVAQAFSGQAQNRDGQSNRKCGQIQGVSSL